jgi:gluconate 2-dehydrogenase gamma chain
MDEEKKKDEGLMKRRDVLKAMTAVPAALVPLGSAMAEEHVKRAPSPSATAPKHATATRPYRLQILTEHEYNTVRVLSDWIVPADDRSGSATQAGVPEFIDDWLNFWRGNLLAEIQGGLIWLDIQCNHHYGHDFVDCSAQDQKNILDRIAYPKTAALEDANAVAFFNRLRGLVLGGFYSSEMGVKDLPYLGNQMVAHWDGCPADVMAKIEENEKKLGLKLL